MANTDGSSWLLVSLHGYGGTGGEFRDAVLAAWPDGIEAVPLLSPDGPHAAHLVGRGRAWHGLTLLADPVRRCAIAAAEPLAGLIASVQATHGIGPARTAIIGFSQGGTIAARLLELKVGAAAAVIGAPVTWSGPAREASAHPALLSVVGADDPRRSILTPLPEALTDGFARTVELPALAHEASPDALRICVRFVADAISTPVRHS